MSEEHLPSNIAEVAQAYRHCTIETNGKTIKGVQLVRAPELCDKLGFVAMVEDGENLQVYKIDPRDNMLYHPDGALGPVCELVMNGQRSPITISSENLSGVNAQLVYRFEKVYQSKQ